MEPKPTPLGGTSAGVASFIRSLLCVASVASSHASRMRRRFRPAGQHPLQGLHPENASRARARLQSPDLPLAGASMFEFGKDCRGKSRHWRFGEWWLPRDVAVPETGGQNARPCWSGPLLDRHRIGTGRCPIRVCCKGLECGKVLGCTNGEWLAAHRPRSTSTEALSTSVGSLLVLWGVARTSGPRHPSWGGAYLPIWILETTNFQRLTTLHPTSHLATNEKC
jgi:hypothetical protein